MFQLTSGWLQKQEDVKWYSQVNPGNIYYLISFLFNLNDEGILLSFEILVVIGCSDNNLWTYVSEKIPIVLYDGVSYQLCLIIQFSSRSLTSKSLVWDAAGLLQGQEYKSWFYWVIHVYLKKKVLPCLYRRNYTIFFFKINVEGFVYVLFDLNLRQRKGIITQSS